MQPLRSAVYLDWNAGAPLHPSVKPALLSFFESDGLGNPSSIHAHGRSAKKLLRECISDIARSIDPRITPQQLLLTSSGTEALQSAIRSTLESALERGEPAHWILSQGEHEAVASMAEWALKRGCEVTRVPLRSSGEIDLAGVKKAVRPGQTRLVSLIWVNNETGVISPLEALVPELTAAGVCVCIDACQAWGKLPLPLVDWGVDFAAFAGHKIGAPAGLGVLYRRQPTAYQALFPGKQQYGARAGTENLMGAVALGAAARHVDPIAFSAELEPLRMRFENEIGRRLPEVRINGKQAKRVANTVNLTLPGKKSAAVITALDMAGFCVSAGSACSSGSSEPSQVLISMGLTPVEALSSIRVSFGRTTDWQSLESFVQTLQRIMSE